MNNSGNHAFANVLDAIVPLSFRIVNDRDVVTTFPKMLFLYKHASQEIVIDRFGNYIFNPSFVEKTILSGRNSLVCFVLNLLLRVDFFIVELICRLLINSAPTWLV
jgi:hypothetical protein